MGISIWQLVIVLVIVLLLFGTKKLRHIGSDLGGAVRGFRSAMKDGSTEEKEEDAEPASIEKEESTTATAESDSAGEKRDSA